LTISKIVSSTIAKNHFIAPPNFTTNISVGISPGLACERSIKQSLPLCLHINVLLL